MAFNGSGTYSLPAGNPVVTGSTISSTTHNNTNSDIATALTNCVTRDGQSPATANIPMGGFKHTNVANATARTEYCSAGQAQDNTFDWLTGVAGTNTITATGPIGLSAYATGQCFRFTSAGANTGATTLNINSIGAKAITKYGTTALASGDIPSGAVIEVVYDGTQFQLVGNGLTTYAPLASPAFTGTPTAPTAAQGTNTTQIATTEFVQKAYGPVGAFRNLQASAIGTNANVSVSADEIVTEDANNTYLTLRSVSLTINTAASGANGLDTGTLAGSTWYSVWVIAKADGTQAGVISTSATAPTLPAGYTFKARIGWTRTDGTANKYPLSFKQYGRRVEYVVASGSNVAAGIQMASGVAGSVTAPTWVGVATANYIPSTAARIAGLVSLSTANNATCMLAPNNSYGAYNSTTNPPPYSTNPSTATYGGVLCFPFDMALESANIYWASAVAGNSLFVTGWEDNL